MGGKGKWNRKQEQSATHSGKKCGKVLKGILPLLKNISLSMFVIIFWIPLG